jgi:integrase
MRWGEITEVWDWQKNKRMHALPLPKLAQRVLIGLKRKDAQPDDLVFADISWQFQHRVKTLSGIADFMPHAIRHTVATKLAEPKVKPYVRDLLLDHATCAHAREGLRRLSASKQ